jgi:phosphopantetheinyl transferase
MALYKQIDIEAGRIGIWKVEETFEELMRFFTEDELQDSEFLKYSFNRRKTEWLATRLLLKNVIGDKFDIAYTRQGKPILSHELYKYLSISHSHSFVAVLVHENKEVGLDLESIERNYKSIQKRYLTETESKTIDENQILQCLYWCAKEAIFKLVAEEGVDFKEQINILPFNYILDKKFAAICRTAETSSFLELHFMLFENQGLVWVVEA